MEVAKMNSIVVSGRITRDGDVYTKDDFKVYKSSVAVQREYKDKAKNDYITDFIDFSAFGNTATYLEKYAKKGDLIIIQGKLYFDEFTKDGEIRKKAYIRVDSANIVPTEKKEKQSSLQEIESDSDFTDDTINVNDEDIPF